MYFCIKACANQVTPAPCVTLPDLVLFVDSRPHFAQDGRRDSHASIPSGLTSRNSTFLDGLDITVHQAQQPLDRTTFAGTDNACCIR